MSEIEIELIMPKAIAATPKVYAATKAATAGVIKTGFFAGPVGWTVLIVGAVLALAIMDKAVTVAARKLKGMQNDID